MHVEAAAEVAGAAQGFHGPRRGWCLNLFRSIYKVHGEKVLRVLGVYVGLLGFRVQGLGLRVQGFGFRV